MEDFDPTEEVMCLSTNVCMYVQCGTIHTKRVNRF